MSEQTRTIGYICPVCGKAVVVERTAFALAAGEHQVIPCPCGKSQLELHQRGETCQATVPCLFCARDHHTVCSTKAMLEEKLLVLSCSASGLGCCFIGEEDQVFAAMEKAEKAVDKLCLDTQEETRGAFLDGVVMGEVLAELKDIAARGGISCGCGCDQYGMKVGYSSVDVVCAGCGATLRLPAATLDDVDDICASYTLHIPGKRAD